MLVMPILSGTIAFFAVSYLVGYFDPSPGAGIIPGIVCAIGAAWQIWKFNCAARNKLLHPQPKLYAVNPQVAFSKIRDALREKYYHYGDKWRIITCDIATMRIVAELRYLDEEEHFDFGHRGELISRTARVQRFLRLEVGMSQLGSGSLVQFDFETRVEGFNITACDSIIKDFIASVESLIGAAPG
jgi:hypothetical protein